MGKENLTKELNKYPKDVIIQALIRCNFGRLDGILEKVKEINRTMQFEKLIARSAEISVKMKKTQLESGITGRLKFRELLEEDKKYKLK